jgi:hypothetical protein
MPKDKDLKRLVRRRMAKTGESYTAARGNIMKEETRSGDDSSLPEVPFLPDDHETLAGMSDAAVRNATGKDWLEWTRTLDAADAVTMTHRDIAAHLHDDLDVPAWWAQMVTVGYERLRGLREPGQRRGGGYDVNKSKTMPVPVADLYRAFDDEALRDRWLPDVALTIRSSTVNKSMRIRMPDDTPLDVYFTAKGEAKSTVSLQHRRLPDKRAADEGKVYWGGRLAALAELLTTE